MQDRKLTAVSLFSSAGIGDLALQAAGVEILVANEILAERASLFKTNFPDCNIIQGDIVKNKENIVSFVRKKIGTRRPDILFATPPCQGMSKNGRGKLLNSIRLGNKPKEDSRNRLFLEIIDIAKKLEPRLIIIENVPEMKNTSIYINNNIRNIMDILNENLSPEYYGDNEVVEFADYGVPQRRKRLITIFSNDKKMKKYFLDERKVWLPQKTHAQHPDLYEKPWVTILDAIGSLEALDGKHYTTSVNPETPFHRVPSLNDEKYFWVSNTPLGKGAFDNQCINPACNYKYNPTHGSEKEKGINKSKKNTPLYCIKCNEILPRPWVKENNEYRLMSGFTSAYKRMRGDLPASALTKNFSYACSDQKLHPYQHRVLSLHEAMIIHTISDFSYRWERYDNIKVSDKLIRDVIGESIPPRGLLIIFKHIISLLKKSE